MICMAHLSLVDLSSHIVYDTSENVSEETVCPLPSVGIHATIQVIFADRFRV